MRLAPVIERLEGLAGVRTVSDVLALADLATQQVALPALFVVPAGETPGRTQEGSSVVVVEMLFEFDVVTVLAAASARGRNRDELETISAAVRDRLFGWTPEPGRLRPFLPSASRLLGAAGGRVSWIQRFRTAQHLRSL